MWVSSGRYSPAARQEIVAHQLHNALGSVGRHLVCQLAGPQIAQQRVPGRMYLYGDRHIGVLVVGI